MLRPAPGAATVLLLGNYRPTIVLARVLARAGHRVIVGLGGDGGAEFSRFTSEVWAHPPIDPPGEFLGALRSFLGERPDIGVVFPVEEEFVRVVSAGRDWLPADRHYALPAPEIVATMLDKVAAYRLAEAAGVPVAPWARVESLAELTECCALLGYPVVLRPLHPTRRLDGHKAVIVDTPEQLRRRVPIWPTGQPALLAQRLVDGRRHNLYFAALGGRIVRLTAADVDRTDQPDGTGLAVAGRTVPVEPALRAYTAALAERLAYHGVGCAQYLVTPDGRGWFLELNPRVGGNHAIAEAAGLDLGALAVRLAAPSSPDVPIVTGRPGLVYAWTYGDLGGLRAARASGRLSFPEALAYVGRIARTFIAADLHMTWRWDDPLPTLALYARRVPGLRRVVAWEQSRLARTAPPRILVGGNALLGNSRGTRAAEVPARGRARAFDIPASMNDSESPSSCD